MPKNNIHNLPKSFSSLRSLSNLRLSDNAINSENDFIVLGEMNNLSLLWLDANKITQLPPGIAHLKVKELYLDNNFINHLPEEIEECSELRVLYLGSLPREFGGLLEPEYYGT